MTTEHEWGMSALSLWFGVPPWSSARPLWHFCRVGVCVCMCVFTTDLATSEGCLLPLCCIITASDRMMPPLYEEFLERAQSAESHLLHLWLALLKASCLPLFTDVIGVCKSADDVSRITTRTSREVSKRTLYLVDTTGKNVAVTLWGEEVITLESFLCSVFVRKLTVDCFVSLKVHPLLLLPLVETCKPKPNLLWSFKMFLIWFWNLKHFLDTTCILTPISTAKTVSLILSLEIPYFSFYWHLNLYFLRVNLVAFPSSAFYKNIPDFIISTLFKVSSFQTSWL